MRRLLTLCVLGLLLTGCDLTVPWTGEDAARAEEVLTVAPKSVRFNASLGEAAPAPLEIFVTARRPVGANVRWPNPPVADVSQSNSGLLVRVVAPRRGRRRPAFGEQAEARLGPRGHRKQPAPRASLTRPCSEPPFPAVELQPTDV